MRARPGVPGRYTPPVVGWSPGRAIRSHRTSAHTTVRALTCCTNTGLTHGTGNKTSAQGNHKLSPGTRRQDERGGSQGRAQRVTGVKEGVASEASPWLGAATNTH